MKITSAPQAYIPVQWRVVVFAVIFSVCTGVSMNTFAELSYTSGPNKAEMQGAGHLPVIITPLKGYYSRGVSHLYWKSLQESNSSHFDIERSNDGVNFVQVGKVMARGVSDKEVEYSFNDIRSNAGLNYYRLKQVDKDGLIHFSNIEMLNVTIQGIYVTGIYPGPFTDKVNVTVSSELRTEISISLFDNTGKLVALQQGILNKGVTGITVDGLDRLAKGMYIMKVQAGETLVVKKLIK